MNCFSLFLSQNKISINLFQKPSGQRRENKPQNENHHNHPQNKDLSQADLQGWECCAWSKVYTRFQWGEAGGRGEKEEQATSPKARCPCLHLLANAPLPSSSLFLIPPSMTVYPKLLETLLFSGVCTTATGLGNCTLPVSSSDFVHVHGFPETWSLWGIIPLFPNPARSWEERRSTRNISWPEYKSPPCSLPAVYSQIVI